MVTGSTLLFVLLLASLVVGLVGVAQLAAGSAARADLVSRSSLSLDERVPLRLRADARLRRTRWGGRLGQRINSAGVELRVVDFVLLLLGAAVVAGLLANLLFPLWASALLGLLGARMCFVWLDREQAQRRDAFIAQLPEVARVLSNASSAGLSLATGVAMAAKELDEPAASELVKIREELRLGASVDQALTNLERRMPSREVSVLVTTLVIQHRAGGDVVSALRDLASTLEARRELLREIRTLMSGEVFSAYLVLILGLGSLVLLNQINPGVIDRMLSSLWGIIALVVSVTLFTVGFVAVRRITRVDA
jgi:tight adherence protein B